MLTTYIAWEVIMSNACCSTSSCFASEKVSGLLRDIGLAEVLAGTKDLAALITGAQKRLSRAERFDGLKVARSANDVEIAEAEFAQARRLATRLSSNVAAIRSDKQCWPRWSQMNSAATQGGVSDALQEARLHWKNALLDSSLDPLEAVEVMEMWDSIAATARDRGPEALLKDIEGWLSEFETILTAKENWGRKPHSPLQWWHWLIIAIIIGAAVATVIACFVFAGCAFIKWIFGGVCLGVSATTGGPLASLCLAIGF
jgi:hypothetical protein